MAVRAADCRSGTRRWAWPARRLFVSPAPAHSVRGVGLRARNTELEHSPPITKARGVERNDVIEGSEVGTLAGAIEGKDDPLAQAMNRMIDGRFEPLILPDEADHSRPLDGEGEQLATVHRPRQVDR